MIDFPAAPVAGQIFFGSNGVIYQYSTTYTSWIMIGSTVQQDASVSASGGFTPSNGVAVVIVFGVVVTGNAGGWLNTTNGRYTPPAGRYLLMCNGSIQAPGGGNGGWLLALRKNGVAVTGVGNNSSGGTLFSVTNSMAAIVDANGTDFFEFTGTANVVGMANQGCVFSAIAIQQAAQIPGTGSAWRQIARVVAPALTATIDFQNIPADINDLMLSFDIVPTTNDDNLAVRIYDGGGVLLTGANYLYGVTANNNASAFGAAAVTGGSTAAAFTTGIVFNYAQTTNKVSNVANQGIAGTLRIPNIRDVSKTKRMTWDCAYLNGAATLLISATGGGTYNAATALSGLRLFTGSTLSGIATLWGSP